MMCSAHNQDSTATGVGRPGAAGTLARSPKSDTVAASAFHNSIPPTTQLVRLTLEKETIFDFRLESIYPT
jgi:hypothetical protein